MNPIPTPVPPIAFAGPALLAALFSYLLMGVLIAQIAQYAQNTGTTDRTYLRVLVTLVAVVQILQFAFITQKAWRVLVLAFDTPALLNQKAATSLALPVLNGIVALGVQAFFAWRIHTIGKDSKYMKPVPALVLVLSLLQFATTIPLSVAFVRSTANLNIYIPIHLSTQLVCDSLITVSMIIVLWEIRQGTQLRKTQNLLAKLIKNSIETGLITTACVAGNLAVYLLPKKNFIGSVFQNVLGFLYAIVLLTTLNRRQDYRSATSDQSEFTEFGIRMSRLPFSTVTETGTHPPQAPAALVVKFDHAMALENPLPASKILNPAQMEHSASPRSSVHEAPQNDRSGRNI